MSFTTYPVQSVKSVPTVVLFPFPILNPLKTAGFLPVKKSDKLTNTSKRQMVPEQQPKDRTFERVPEKKHFKTSDRTFERVVGRAGGN